MVIRKLLFALGYRYRLLNKKPPEKSDLALQGKRKVILYIDVTGIRITVSTELISYMKNIEMWILI